MPLQTLHTFLQLLCVLSFFGVWLLALSADAPVAFTISPFLGSHVHLKQPVSHSTHWLSYRAHLCQGLIRSSFVPLLCSRLFGVEGFFACSLEVGANVAGSSCTQEVALGHQPGAGPVG